MAANKTQYKEIFYGKLTARFVLSLSDAPHLLIAGYC